MCGWPSVKLRFHSEFRPAKSQFQQGKFPNFRPRPPRRLQIPSNQSPQKLLRLQCCTCCCPPEASAARGMKSPFWSVPVKQAWDSVPPEQDAQPPLLLSFSEDRGSGLFPSIRSLACSHPKAVTKTNIGFQFGRVTSPESTQGPPLQEPEHLGA